MEGASYYLYEDAECTDLLCKLTKTDKNGLAHSGKETLTQDVYYLTDYVKGAEFTVKLQSDIDKNGWDNAKVHDVLVTDEKGYALSKELPYGTYLVRETKVPKDLYKTKDFTITVTEDSREPQQWRVFNDGPFKAYMYDWRRVQIERGWCGR